MSVTPPGLYPGYRRGRRALYQGVLRLQRQSLERLFLRSGEWGLHTALTGIHPLHESSAVQPNEAHWWGAFLLSLWLMPARARSSGRNAHIRSSTLVYVSKSNYRKKLSETCTHPEVRFFFCASEILYYTSTLFFETLLMLSMKIQLFNSVNNSECMKQHCTPFKAAHW